MKNKKGLTLIELLAVIAIIAILFVLLIPQVNSAIEKARIAGAQTDMRSYQVAAQSYFMENQGQPKSAEDFNKYLDEELQFVDGKSKEENPWGKPYELVEFPEGFTIETVTNEKIDGNKIAQYEMDLIEVNGEFVTESNVFDEVIAVEPPLEQVDGDNDGWDDNTNLPLGETSNAIDSDFSVADNTDGTVSITSYSGQESDLVIPSKIKGKVVTKIGGFAFCKPTSCSTSGQNTGSLLTSVIIPNTVTEIAHNAFYQNILTEITIPNSVVTIGNSAFNGNQLSSVVIPNSVTSIGSYVFQHNQLKSAILSNKITFIGNGTFANNQLTSIVIPEGVTSIYPKAFRENQLASISLPSTLTMIGDEAFYENKLTSVSIPKNTNSIGNSSFYNNLGLKSVTNCSSFTLGTSHFNSSPEFDVNGC